MALTLNPRNYPKSLPCGHWNFWLNPSGECGACEKRVPLPEHPHKLNFTRRKKK